VAERLMSKEISGRLRYPDHESVAVPLQAPPRFAAAVNESLE
jgi:hypothetical protein